jgi:hypothetical protein
MLQTINTCAVTIPREGVSMRRSLMSLAIALTLLVTAAGRDVAAKPADLIGQNPTDRFEGEFQNLTKLITAGSYIGGFDFSIAREFKPKKNP